jgi:hypothetical protein
MRRTGLPFLDIACISPASRGAAPRGPMSLTVARATQQTRIIALNMIPVYPPRQQYAFGRNDNSYHFFLDVSAYPDNLLVLSLGLRGPRKIAEGGNRGPLWGEQHRIETGTKRNHFRGNSVCLTIGGNYSRFP